MRMRSENVRREKIRSLNSPRKIRLQQDRFHRWLQFNDLPYSLFINVRAHGGRLTSTVFHLESINIPAREPRRKQRARDERRAVGEREGRARARDFICPDTWFTWCTRQVGWALIAGIGNTSASRLPPLSEILEKFNLIIRDSRPKRLIPSYQ